MNSQMGCQLSSFILANVRHSEYRRHTPCLQLFSSQSSSSIRTGAHRCSLGSGEEKGIKRRLGRSYPLSRSTCATPFSYSNDASTIVTSAQDYGFEGPSNDLSAYIHLRGPIPPSLSYRCQFVFTLWAVVAHPTPQVPSLTRLSFPLSFLFSSSSSNHIKNLAYRAATNFSLRLETTHRAPKSSRGNHVES